MNFEIRNGDVLEELEKLNADPPYCSGSMSPGSVMQGASSSKYCQSPDLPTFVDAMSQRVFQSFAGGIAALSLGYNYTGIEQSEEFVAMSRERLTNALKVYETTGTLVDDVNNQRELLFV